MTSIAIREKGQQLPKGEGEDEGLARIARGIIGPCVEDYNRD